jgi:hypothetical protein
MQHNKLNRFFPDPDIDHVLDAPDIPDIPEVAELPEFPDSTLKVKFD